MKQPGSRPAGAWTVTAAAGFFLEVEFTNYDPEVVVAVNGIAEAMEGEKSHECVVGPKTIVAFLFSDFAMARLARERVLDLRAEVISGVKIREK